MRSESGGVDTGVASPSTKRDLRPVAIFWDQSLIWGLICLETLRQLRVPFRLLSASDIARGGLDGYRVLVVPGGWAKHKMEALGSAGQERIGRFVSEGGSYLGFCGGAGLALSSPPSLGLVPLQRLPLQRRLPSASGQIIIRSQGNHPIWRDLPEKLQVSVWWPSQFKWDETSSSRAVAAYDTLGRDFWIADLPLSDLEMQAMDHALWEQVYGINLSPALLLGQPAIIESQWGQGRLVLSYPHLETPEDTDGHRLLINILEYLDAAAAPHDPKVANPAASSPKSHGLPGKQALLHLQLAAAEVEELVRFGQRHLLWNWRLPWLLHWRRGIRGLEYGSLSVLLQRVVSEAQRHSGALATSGGDPWVPLASRLQDDLQRFCALAKQLLLEEKLAGQSGNFKKLGQVNAIVDNLRAQLFGTQMNHSGLCRTIFDQLDRMLYWLLTESGPHQMN